ncbi:RNA polymerase sigma-70 factor (ECF subfamily) [Salinibacter ruber]|uniref:RNA polymerase sigma-70 factor n=1 Tax=Salinibacter ruber TaxID=146919 RepID=UPI002169660E|nr:RNA polymerase sigma-70 factor (ECF subfamily) [Salinibacter ruber]
MDSQDDASSAGDVLQVQTREDFSAVFRDLYAPLVRYARGLSSDGVSARDAVQEVFTSLWEDRSEIVVRSSLEALLYTMVRNRVLNANRNRKNRAENASPRDIEDQKGLGTTSADESVTAKHLRQRLSAWIDDLPPRRREAFILSRYHGLSHEEIAQVMDVSRRTASTHVMHALQDLRRQLDALRNEDDLP